MPDTAGTGTTAAAPAEAPATRQERVDFLKQSIAFTEANIRSYDTKAQISLAAFVLSMSPLWSILNSMCPQMAAKPGIAVLLFVYMLTILLYCYVLWPMRSPAANLTAGLTTSDLFYVKNPLEVGGTRFLERLKLLSVETELAAETLKLSYIRAGKHVRFKLALAATFVFYIVVATLFLLMRTSCT